MPNQDVNYGSSFAERRASLNKVTPGSRTGRYIRNPKADNFHGGGRKNRTLREAFREMENANAQNEQREYMAETNIARRIPGKFLFDYSYAAPPTGVHYGDGSLYSSKTEFNPKDIDTPQPEMSRVKREAKAAKRQRMKTPGLGDVKAAERQETKPKSIGSMLRSQMMKQQPSKKR